MFSALIPLSLFIVLWDYWFVICDCMWMKFISVAVFYFFKGEDEGWTDYLLMVHVVHGMKQPFL